VLGASLRTRFPLSNLFVILSFNLTSVILICFSDLSIPLKKKKKKKRGQMALPTLAEWTGSTIVSNLVDAASSYLGEHLLPADTQGELNRLKAALPKITAVLTVAELLKLKHPNSGLNAWLQQFKQAFLAAEDVLDELKYQELEDMIRDKNDVSGSFSSILGSFKRKFPCSNINKDTLARLRDAVKILDLVVTDVGIFFQFATSLHIHGSAESQCEAGKISNRETTCFLTESKVFGRENEKAKVIEWLKKRTSHAHISAFCIVGAGGLGKTTLAQLIFEDISRENHFDETIWVCVSTSFSVEQITRKILQEIGVKTDGNESLNGLQKKIKEKVHSKKILCILDDVWNDDKMCDWQKLIAPLRFVQEGSKILLTTRMKPVAEMLARVLNVDQECLVLRGLKEQELLMLFNKYAFHGYNPDNHKDLQKIGNDIVKKLHGSPLAAKVIGSLLNSNVDFQYWKRILTCGSLINLEQAKSVSDVLKLSYCHLSTDLQECFRFCSIFPQDYSYEKNRLIRMWIASGFIRQKVCREERPEDIAEEYFNHLLKKMFFEPLPGRGDLYTMHDLMHELAQNVSEGECCRVELNDKSVNIPSNTKHVYIHGCEIERVFDLRNLRTLVITMSLNTLFSDNKQFVLPNGALKETLRVLDIHLLLLCTCELPKEIGSLIHLRYLTIREGSGNLLPRSICNLHHLQVLEWHGENFETPEINNLVSLRHLKLPDQMMQNIKGVHKLTSLQSLNFFVGKEKGHHIDELNSLNNLRELSIQQVENVRDPAEAEKAELSKKENLISLSLNWTRRSNYDKPEKIIDSLQPPLYIKKLTIYNYIGNTSPVWMKNLPFLELSSLTLSICPLWKDLPLLAQMPHLRKLYLRKMSEVKELDYSFESTTNTCAFPFLEHLHCVDMPKWQSWKEKLTGQHGFPKLKNLVINNCPNLAELPDIPLSLSKFEVSRVGLNSLPNVYLSSNITIPAPSSLKSSLRVVEIVNCPNLRSLDGFLQQKILDLEALELLTVESCENLEQLSVSAFGKLGSLKHLCIYENPKLVAVDSERILLPVKLQTIRLGNCGELDAPMFESASCLPNLAKLYITNSASVTHIPTPENAFLSLRELHIDGCDKLVEFSSMAYTKGISPENNMTSLKINSLNIPHLSLLFIEPLRSLKFVRQCGVHDCSGMGTLPEHWLLQNSATLEALSIEDASSLRSLPGRMVRLTVLKRLNIRNAILLKEIPELPISLVLKRIIGAGGRHLV
jgi:NB-ARC domain/Rx N-terminal domain